MRALLRFGLAVHVAVYRLSGGRLLGRMGKGPVLLLTVTGRRTGKRRTVPLIYQRDGERYIVMASAGGQAKHPTWWLNLRANPTGEIEVGRSRIAVEAKAATPEEKPRLWQLMTSVYAGYDRYQRKTTRQIDVVILTPNQRS